jgi:hypothetical protein
MKVLTGMAISLLLVVPAVYAEGASDLAKAAQNPIANLISLPLQNNTNFNVGPQERTQNILNIQPVYPLSINDDWNVITRTILPVTYVSSGETLGDATIPSPVDESHIFGLGDTTFTASFSPKDSGDLTWGVGPVILLPTSTDDALGAGEWGAGLSAVVLGMPGNWVVGSLFSMCGHQTSICSPGSTLSITTFRMAMAFI